MSPFTFLSIMMTCYFRLYTDHTSRERDSMKTVKVLDVWQHQLKSKNNYAAALAHIMHVCPPLQAITNDNVTAVMGDWPTWYYLKKIIAQVSYICHFVLDLTVLLTAHSNFICLFYCNFSPVAG